MIPLSAAFFHTFSGETESLLKVFILFNKIFCDGKRGYKLYFSVFIDDSEKLRPNFSNVAGHIFFEELKLASISFYLIMDFCNLLGKINSRLENNDSPRKPVFHL